MKHINTRKEERGERGKRADLVEIRIEGRRVLVDALQLGNLPIFGTGKCDACPCRIYVDPERGVILRCSSRSQYERNEGEVQSEEESVEGMRFGLTNFTNLVQPVDSP